MEDKEKKGLSDAARRRAEDAKKARELRKQAQAEMAAEEDKRRAAELLKGQNAGVGQTNRPETAPRETVEAKPETFTPSAEDIKNLLASDPKAAMRAMLEAKGADKEDLDAYAQSDRDNSNLNRILDAFGGRTAYRTQIAEANSRNAEVAENRLNQQLSMMDVSEMAVTIRNYYTEETKKAEQKEEEEKIQKQKNLLLRIPGPIMKLMEHGYILAGIYLLSRPDTERVWIGMAIAFAAYMVLFGWQNGIFGQRAKNPKGYSVILPVLTGAAILFGLSKIRRWLWYSWISGAFYRLLCMVLMIVFAVVGGAIFAGLSGMIESADDKKRK